MSVAGTIVVLSLILALALFAWRRPRRREDPRRRAERRAHEVAAALGLRAQRDPDVPTTWIVEGTVGDLLLRLSMGSPREMDWLVLTLRGRKWLPDEVHIRPAHRSVFDWKDGLPGEPSNVDAHGVGLVIEPPEALRTWPFLEPHIERLPHRAYPERADPVHLQLRASPDSDTSPVAVVRDLMAAAASWAKAAEGA